MFVDVTCSKCGTRSRIDLGPVPPGLPAEEHLRRAVDRLSHQPSFGCFGGHFELAPPVPRFWTIHWETLGDS